MYSLNSAEAAQYDQRQQMLLPGVPIMNVTALNRGREILAMDSE